MAADDDDDKTVFGGPLSGGTPFGQRPTAGQQPPAVDAWGKPVPPQQPGGSGASPFGQPAGPAPTPFGQAQPGSASPFGDNRPGGSPLGAAQGGQTWLGNRAPAPNANPGQIGRAAGSDAPGFFPDFNRGNQPQPAQQAPRIALHEALHVRELGAASSSNPLLASAASLLILLGRLRTGLVELQVAPLMEHVTREIDRFERNALTAGISPHETLVAKYALSGTADDIVQNLPGSARGDWQQYSMVARFFHKRDSGVGFFQEAEKAMQAPAQQYNLLELMLVCLSLGFEGQFRTMPNGAAELARIRSAIYESLRRVNPRPAEDISVTWEPVIQGQGRRFGAIPIPAVLGIAAAVVLGVFTVFVTLINRDGAEAAEAMRGLHKGIPIIQVDRTGRDVEVKPFVAENTQLDRLRDAFSQEISDGLVKVEAKGDYIAIRVGNLQLFDTGAVEVKPGFADLAGRIAEVLNSEQGPILIEGHTDNVPMSGRGRYKDNYQLSEARAEGVAEMLRPLLSDAARVTIEGRGEDEPVADNAAPEGRSENRRVEIMLAREGTYGAAVTGGAETTDGETAPQAEAPTDNAETEAQN